MMWNQGATMRERFCGQPLKKLYSMRNVSSRSGKPCQSSQGNVLALTFGIALRMGTRHS